MQHFGCLQKKILTHNATENCDVILVELWKTGNHDFDTFVQLFWKYSIHESVDKVRQFSHLNVCDNAENPKTKKI